MTFIQELETINEVAKVQAYTLIIITSSLFKTQSQKKEEEIIRKSSLSSTDFRFAKKNSTLSDVWKTINKKYDY